jgi:hypothetical protein
MAHILTDTEALNALRRISDEVPNLELLLSGVDDDIMTATEHDWTADAMIDPTAKLAASLLLIAMFEGNEPPSYYDRQIGKLDGKVANCEVS